VRQPLCKMGKIAAETVLRRIARDGADYPRRIAVEPELVVRESTCKAGRANVAKSNPRKDG